MQSERPDDIVVCEQPIDPQVLCELVARFLGDMVKLVVDVRLRRVGELHADAEAILLGGGSRQVDLWGANYYPGMGAENCL